MAWLFVPEVMMSASVTLIPAASPDVHVYLEAPAPN